MATATDHRPDEDVTRPHWVAVIRSKVVRLPFGRTVWRVGIGVIGLVIVAGGIVLLPLPGPGWVIIFVGVGAWATEFRWAGRLLRRVKRFAEQSSDRIKRMPTWAKLLVGVAVLVVVALIVAGGWYVYAGR